MITNTRASGLVSEIANTDNILGLGAEGTYFSSKNTAGYSGYQYTVDGGAGVGTGDPAGGVIENASLDTNAFVDNAALSMRADIGTAQVNTNYGANTTNSSISTNVYFNAGGNYYENIITDDTNASQS